ncbi:MAG: DUF692 domain-containing protein [Bacteroidota bacterium]
MNVKGVGIGFRRDISDFILSLEGKNKPSFVELAPENWMNIGGEWKKTLHQIAEKYPITCHGLSLSIGSPDEPDWEFLKQIKKFIKETPVQLYSEHLSFSKCDNAHLYELLPIPFREDAVKHIVNRINQVQDFLEMQLVIENVSYYTPVAAEMKEEEFISQIVQESNCGLLLDINNVFVNSFNHKYNPKDFIASLPLDNVKYIHMAGHEQVAPDLIIDTHGQPIVNDVFELYNWTINYLKPVPVLLERDFNFEDKDQIMSEINQLKKISNLVWKKEYVA